MTSMFFQVCSEESPDLAVTARVEGNYNPDVLTDVVNRTVWAYKEALDHHVAKLGYATPETKEEEAE